MGRAWLERPGEELPVIFSEQAGFHPSKRHPLPGTQKVWEGQKILWNAVVGYQAISEWKKDKKTED